MSKNREKIFPIFAEVRKITAVLDDQQFGQTMRYALDCYFDGSNRPDPEPLVKLASDVLLNQAARYDSYREQQRSNRLAHRDDDASEATEGNQVQPITPPCPCPSPDPNPINDICDHVVQLLNDLSGSSYRSNSKQTLRLISARVRDGYTLDDFEAVIHHQCDLWINDITMQQYLRPETLFGGKFDSYLSNARRTTTNQEQSYTLAPLDDPYDTATGMDY